MALIRKYFWPGLASTLALGAIFAFLGVYDTDNLPFHMRYVFWTTTMVTGTVTSALASPWVFNHLLRGHNLLLQLVVVAAIVSCPVLLVIVGFNTGFTAPWPTNDLPIQFARVFAVSFILVSGTYFVVKALGLIDASPDPDAASASPVLKFLARLPAKYRGAELYAVSSEDHYLRVHTDRGEELILMRLSDAMRELEGAAGLQTHRSWWVSHGGVDQLTRDNGKQTLTLKSGVVVPVSRSFAQAVRDADLGDQ